jgi:hypothetical protein
MLPGRKAGRAAAAAGLSLSRFTLRELESEVITGSVGAADCLAGERLVAPAIVDGEVRASQP